MSWQLDMSESPRAEMVAGAIAGVVSTLLGHPLDVVKAHLQTQKRMAKLSTVSAAGVLLRESGGAVLLRGIAPPMANAVVMNTVMFSAFNTCRGVLPETMAGVTHCTANQTAARTPIPI